MMAERNAAGVFLDIDSVKVLITYTLNLLLRISLRGECFLPMRKNIEPKLFIWMSSTLSFTDESPKMSK